MIRPTHNPDSETSDELRFYLLHVDDERGNPAQLIEWRGKSWRLTRTDSNMMQAIYRPAERQP